MRALVNTTEGVRIKDIPNPAINSSQALVRVRANALNRADLMILGGTAHGAWGSGDNVPLGLEWSGEIVEIGKDLTGFKVGDRVMGSGGGAFAEYTVGNIANMIPVPVSFSFEQATTMPVAFRTMHDAIVTNGNLAKGETVFFQGASSAVGLLGMQIAKYLGAGKVIGTSNMDERCKLLHDFGCDVSINTENEDWVQQSNDATNGKGADLMIDFLAGPYMDKNFEVIKVGGTIVNIGRMAGEHWDTNFDLLNMKCIKLIGASHRMRTPAQAVELTQKAIAALLPALNAGALKLPVDKIYPFEQAMEAFDRMTKNEHFGKIILIQE